MSATSAQLHYQGQPDDFSLLDHLAEEHALGLPDDTEEEDLRRWHLEMHELARKIHEHSS